MDEIIRAVSKDGFAKISVVTARDAVQCANAIHHCSPTAIAALGRSLCAASMLGDLLKEENGTVTLRINGGGGLGTIVAVSDCDGNVRGMVANPAFDLPTRPDGKLDVGGAVGKDGMLTVSRDIGLREPYIGSTELVSGEIAEDLSAYLVESEQIAAACGLGVLVDTDHSVKAAGGFLVQLMPGAPEELIGKLEDNIFMMDQLTTILDEDGVDAIIAQVMRDLAPEIVLRHPMAYRCACSRARVEQALRQCGADELRAMIAEGEDTRVHCQFCDTEYVFTPADLQTLLDAENPDTASLQCKTIRRRTCVFYNLLARLDSYFMPLIYQMSDIVKTEGDDYSCYGADSKKIIASCASVAVSIKSVLDTPLLTDDGLLTDASEGTATNIEGFLKNLKIPY